MFVYFIPLTVNLTKNSKLEKFVHELNALWKLSGSSMGALRELVAVAGIIPSRDTNNSEGNIFFKSDRFIGRNPPTVQELKKQFQQKNTHYIQMLWHLSRNIK
jgi:hypothetical protein